MTYDDNVIDAEVVEVVETPNLPVRLDPKPWSDEVMEEDTVSRSNGVTYGAKPGRTAAGLSLDAAAVARHDAALASNPERQCSATNSKGERCRKFAIAGSSCCRSHGGATKHIRNSARIRVENATNKLVGKLIEFAFDDTKPPETQLRAIRDALDRGGLKPPSEVALSQGEPKAYETVFDSIGGTHPDESLSVAASPAPAFNPETTFGSASADAGEAWHSAAEDDQPSSRDVPPPRPPRRDRDRDRPHKPPERHITGEAAIRMANQANLAIGAMKAIESPHKGYRRP